MLNDSRLHVMMVLGLLLGYVLGNSAEVLAGWEMAGIVGVFVAVVGMVLR